MQLALFRGAPRLVFRLIEILSHFDDGRAESAHRRVLIGRVSSGHIQFSGNAGACRCERDRLAVISARGGDYTPDTRHSLYEPIDIDQPAPDFESARGSVVLV